MPRNYKTMKLLCFLASHFAWTPFSQTIEDADEAPTPDGFDDAVVIFMHIEEHDLQEDNYKRAFKHTLKHVKWLANKKGFTNIALHSFAHLGGSNAAPEGALDFMQELQQRLESTGYQVKMTPFGWFCSWDLQVLGDSLAKVWKEI